MKGKIVELQGLRCVGIVSVLLFHIWPNIFYNGFLGVDIFFVLSGYIMAMILLPSNSLQKSFFKTTLKFYYRRLYRILPLYLFNIFATIILVPAISFTYFYANFLEQVKQALTFSVNFSMLFTESNYFETGLTYTWFKHYWSLCVEMQFYLIVPFIFYISKKLSLKINLLIFWPSLIGFCISLILFMLFNYGIFGAFFIFTMLPARIYEFIGGIFAFHVQEIIQIYFNDSKLVIKLKKIFQSVFTVNFLTLLLFTITLIPVKISDIYAMASTTVITSTLIIAIGRNQNQKNEKRYSILVNNIFVFLGDASYSLYICHWIIVHLSKLIYPDDEQRKFDCKKLLIVTNIKFLDRQLVFLICIIVGFIVHLWIEKPLIKARLKPESFFPWLIFGYLIIGYIAFTNQFTRPISDITKDIFHNQSKQFWNATKREEITKYITPDISAELGFHAWQDRCLNNEIYINKTGTGNLSVLLIGNSHALCIIPGLESALAGKYSKIKKFIVGAQTPFEGFKNGIQLSELRKVVKENKSDVIFLIFKYLNDMDEPGNDENDENAKIKSMQEMIDFLSKNTKFLFISEMDFEVFGFSSLKWAEQIWRNGWTSDYSVKRKEIEAVHAVSTRRWKEIKCKNCIFINMLDVFCSKGLCSALDESRKVPLLIDAHHLTKLGAYSLTKHLQKYLKNMDKFIEIVNK